MADLLSYLGVKPHLDSLHLCGCYQLDANSSEMKKNLHTVYRRLVLFVISVYTCQQIMKVYQERDDLNKVMATMFLLLTNSDCIYKLIVFWSRAHRIELLFDTTKGPIFNQKKEEHREFLLTAGRQARFLLRGFNISALFTCMLWVLYPVILYLQSKPLEFAIWLPFDANQSPQFYYVAMYVWLQTSFLAFCNTSMDVFIVFFLIQSKAQLCILRLDLEQLVEKSKEEAKITSEKFDDILDRRLNIILMHYAEITKFCTIVMEVFGGSVFYFFFVSSWIMCTSAYRMVNIDPMTVEFASMVMYMFCILVELFMYCFYGTEVTYESDKLIESAYSLNWLEISLKHKRALIMFMERSKRNIDLMAGNLIPLSNSTSVSIVRSSYTFYAFLKNTN